MSEIIHVASKDVAPLEIYPGARFLKLDVHHPGPEEIYVVSGVFNDGLRD